MTRLTKKILSAVLAGAMVLAMGVSAFAADDAPAEATLKKTLDIAEGVTVPGATFNFKVEELSALDGEGDPTVSTGSTGFTQNVTISAADAAAESGKEVALSTIFENATFPHAGVYAYKITEDAATYTAAENETLTINTEGAEYTVIVEVKNGTDGVEVGQILIRDKDGEKTTSAEFNNKYEKKNTDDDKPLTISKTVAGSMGDKASKFSFTLTITKPEGADDTSLTGVTGKIGDEDVTIAYGTPVTFKLKDGEELKVTGLLFGSKYQVVEAAEDATIQNYSQYETKVAVNGTNKDGKDSGETLLTDTTDNTVAFTNTLDSIIPTGVIINNLPYMLMVAIAVAGVAYMQLKKRI